MPDVVRIRLERLSAEDRVRWAVANLPVVVPADGPTVMFGFESCSTSSGTLAELLGPAALPNDVQLRTLGLSF